MHLAGFAFGLIPIGLLIYGGPAGLTPAPLSYTFGVLLIALGATTGYFGSRVTYQKHGLRAWEGFGFLVILLLLAFILSSSYSTDSINQSLKNLYRNYAWMPDEKFVLFAFIAPFVASFWMLRRETRSPVLSLQTDKLLNGAWSGELSKNFAILPALVLIIFLQNSFNVASIELIERFFGTKDIFLNGAMPSIEMIQKSVSAQQFVPFLSGAFGGWAMWLLTGKRGFFVLCGYRILRTFVSFLGAGQEAIPDFWKTPELQRMFLIQLGINLGATFGGLLLGAWVAASSLKKVKFA